MSKTTLAKELDALAVPCPACKVPAGVPCPDQETRACMARHEASEGPWIP